MGLGTQVRLKWPIIADIRTCLQARGAQTCCLWGSRGTLGEWNGGRGQITSQGGLAIRGLTRDYDCRARTRRGVQKITRLT